MHIVDAVKEAGKFDSDFWMLYLPPVEKSSYFKGDSFADAALKDSLRMKMASASPQIKRYFQTSDGLLPK